ncbi:MAG TPA: hypothetical protein VFK73_00715, partial [Paludibacter sp.]|nr:hypothetical protein [Paludibacter sp.]
MKRNYRLKFLSIICALSFILSSCNSGIDLSVVDDPSIKIDGSLAIPIGEENLTIKDVIEKIGLPSGVDTVSNEIYLQWAFTDEMGFKTLNLADSIKPFDKQYYPADYIPLSVGIPLPVNSNISIEIPDFFDLGINGNVDEQRVDSIKVNSSQIDINFDVSDDLKAQFLQASDFTIQFIFDKTNLKVDDGAIPTYNPSQYNENGKITIGKYSMYLNGLQKLPYKILIKLKPSVPVTFSALSYVNINMKFSNIDFAVAYGLFDLTEIEQKQVKIPFNIEDYLPKMHLKFANPLVQITATTNVGADLNIKVNYISAYNDSNPANKTWAWFDNHTTNEKTEQIPGPTKVGEWTSKPFELFDSKNGETDQLFDSKPYPNMLDYMYLVSSDPARKNNYITPDSKVNLDIKINIPLKIKGGNTYSFSDTIENLNFETLPDNVDSAILVLKLKNGLPLKANYRMTFHKSNLANDTIPAVAGVITKVSDELTLGNMTSEYVVYSPHVDDEGTVTEIIPQTIKIRLNKSEIAELKQTHFIVFHVTLDSEKKIVNGVETSNAIHITTNNSF